MTTEERKAKIEAQKEKALEKPAPVTERVSPIEVWLLDPATRQRKKRICGRQKSSFPEGYVCLNEAGKGTPHIGYGLCSSHERILPQTHKVSLWRQIRAENPKIMPTLGEALDISDRIEDEDLKNVNDDIRMLYALLQVHLDCKKSEWQKDRADHALNLVKEIIKAKETKSRIEKTILLDPRSISAFLQQVFSIIKKSLTETDARLIMQTIYTDIVIPMNQKGSKGEAVAQHFAEKFGAKIKNASYRDVTNDEEKTTQETEAEAKTSGPLRRRDETPGGKWSPQEEEAKTEE